MTDVEQHALARTIKSPSGATVITFLRELARAEAESATLADDPNTSFSHSQRARGIIAAYKQLEALAKEPYTNEYAT